MIALNNLLIKGEIYTLGIWRNMIPHDFRVIYKGKCENDVYTIASGGKEELIQSAHEFIGGKSLAYFLDVENVEKKDTNLVARVLLNDGDFFINDDRIAPYGLMMETHSKNSDEYQSILNELKIRGIE